MEYHKLNNWEQFREYQRKEAHKSYIVGFIMMSIIILFCLLCRFAFANEVECIMGEASNQGYNGMLAVAVGIRNRETTKGVYGCNAKHIHKEPKWVWNMAKRAWLESEYNRIHEGTH